MDTKEVKVSHDGPVTIISINRPHVRNAINKSTAQALKDAWLDFEADENALVG
jgi:enoyl-CoA hydratase